VKRPDTLSVNAEAEQMLGMDGDLERFGDPWLIESISVALRSMARDGGAVGAMRSVHRYGNDYQYGPMLTGDDAVVEVTCRTSEGRDLNVQEVRLDELWRLPDAGLQVVRVRPATSALYTWGVAWDVFEEDWWVSTIVVDYTGAAVALLDPHVFDRTIGGAPGPGARRARWAAELAAQGGESGRGTDRAIAASAASEYLAEQAAEPSDGGYHPNVWLVARKNMETKETVVLASSGDVVLSGDAILVVAGGQSRRGSSIITRASAEWSRDVSGRTRVNAKGSSRQWVPRTKTSAPNTAHEIEWGDPVGDEASRRADATVAPGGGDLAAVAALLPPGEPALDLLRT